MEPAIIGEALLMHPQIVFPRVLERFEKVPQISFIREALRAKELAVIANFRQLPSAHSCVVFCDLRARRKKRPVNEGATFLWINSIGRTLGPRAEEAAQLSVKSGEWIFGPALAFIGTQQFLSGVLELHKED